MSKGPVITTDCLTRRFGETIAVNELTLEVYAGEVFGFLGHNGAGKTTTVRLLNGVLEPSSGRAMVLGMDPARDGPKLRRYTGVLIETPSLDDRLTARENLELFAAMYGVPPHQVTQRVTALLQTFELDDRADDRVGGYSKGMRQRLAIARALLHDPLIVFLDEPTSGLDPVATRNVHRLVGQLVKEGRTIFLCTHNLNEAQRLCDRVAVLEHGRVIAMGTPAELRRQFQHRARLEIEIAPEQVPLALQLLRGLSYTHETSTENGTITVLGADREQIPNLLAGLVKAGVRIYRVSPGEVSLEDVYFALHGQSEVMR